MTKQPSPNTRYSIDFLIGSETEHLPIQIRRLSRSRSIVIRYQPLRHSLSLTIPRYVTIKQGLDFVQEKREWIIRQIKSHDKHIPFAHEQVIPFLGRPYRLCHLGGRGVIEIVGDKIHVHGDSEFMARRVREWLKAQAQNEITRLAKQKAAKLGVSVKKIVLRDTSSRWGSCSHDGSLSFSWRLVFAPYEVLDYLVAHEVAHLVQHNHSPAYWKVVAQLCPEHKTWRDWLKKYGNKLYAYG